VVLSYRAQCMLLSFCDMSRILEAITSACPSFAPEILSLAADGASDSRLMAELASHVVDLFQEGQVECIPVAFELAEYMIADGTAEERHASIVGFLETVQNVASHRSFGARAFEPFLGTMSQRAWLEVNDIWQGKTSLAEVVASETGAKLDPHWWQFWKRRDRRTPSQLLSEVENPELRRIIEQITRE
jgi:hypothetical protein